MSSRGPAGVSSQLLAAAVAVGLLSGCGSQSATWTVSDSQRHNLAPVSFHFNYAPGLKRVAPDPGSYVKIEKMQGEALVESLAVSPLNLAGQHGLPTAYLPIYIERFRSQIADRYPNARFVEDGRAKVNGLAGYQIFFLVAGAAPGGGELTGRVVLLPQYDLKKGVVLTAMAGQAAGFDRWTLLGDKGLLETTFESFDFGS